MKKLILAVLLTTALKAQNYSVQFPSTALLRATGTATNSAYNGLNQWRVEMRLHGLPTWSGNSVTPTIWQVGNYVISFGMYSATERWLYFTDNTPNEGLGCGINLPSGLTNLTLRAQRNSAGYRSMGLWDDTGAALTVGCWDGPSQSTTQTPRATSDDLRGSTSYPQSIGGNIWGGAFYPGAMAFFRLFSTSTTSTSPPSQTSGSGNLLNYEFENNLNDTSGMNQALTVYPSGSSFSYIPTPGSGGSGGPVSSVQFPSTALLRATGTATNSAYNGLNQWRVEMRLHGLPTWSGNSVTPTIWQVGNYVISFGMYSATERWLYFTDNTPNEGLGCGINLPSGLTNLTLRAQRNSAGYRSMGLWDDTGAALTVGCWDGPSQSTTQTPRATPDDLRGSTSYPQSIGGNIWGGAFYPGAMAFFRLFSTSTTSTSPPSQTSGSGNLLNYEFENNLNDTSGMNQALTVYPSGSSFSYIPTPGSGGGDTTPPSVSITAPSSGAPVWGTTTISANVTDNVAVAQVKFYVDGALIDTLTTPPYSTIYNFQGGAGNITVTAWDTANNQALRLEIGKRHPARRHDTSVGFHHGPRPAVRRFGGQPRSPPMSPTTLRCGTSGSM